MTRSEAIARLSRHADALRARGATALYLFGSVAHGEARRESDLDVFLDYDPSANFSLLDLVDIKQFLKGELAVEVDVTTRDSLHPLMRHEIERSAVRVF